jgi:threonine synthase
MLRAIRESNGGAVAVDEVSIEPAAAEVRRTEGIDAGPEAGAAFVALQKLREGGAVSMGERVVVFNTGGDKYRG